MGKSLSVTATSLSVETEGDNDPTVITLGRVKNTSATCFENLMVEVRYFNAKGENIDTFTQVIRRFHSPPGSDISFRVWDHPLRPRAAYATQTVRVVSARPVLIESDGASAQQPQAQPRQPQEKPHSFFVTLLINWIPMLLLIGVWVLLMWRYTRKGSVQQRQMAALEAQTALLERQAAAIEMLAQRAVR
jgi:hypothetical protein